MKSTDFDSLTNIENIEFLEFLGKSVIISCRVFMDCKNIKTVTFPNAEQIEFTFPCLKSFPKDAQILVRRSVKLSGYDLNEWKKYIRYIETKTEKNI